VSNNALGHLHFSGRGFHLLAAGGNTISTGLSKKFLIPQIMALATHAG
jgi:hypothetical protein